MKIQTAFILYHDSPVAMKNLKACVESCKEHGVNPVPFQGVKCIDQEYAKSQTRLTIDSYFQGETECTIGHVKIWEYISALPHGIYAVFENDVIVVGEMPDIQLTDEQVAFLGFRVRERDQYIFPKGEETDLIPTTNFEGAHAYALTPGSAKRLLHMLATMDDNHVDSPVDGLLGINNRYKSELLIVDPPPVVCWVRETRSFSNTEPASYNIQPTPKFLSGINLRESYNINRADQRMTWQYWV